MTNAVPAQTWMTVWTPERVAMAADGTKDGPRAFADYCQQTLGIPWPTVSDLATLRKEIDKFFDHYPQADYYTLCRLAVWCRGRKKRFERVWMVVMAFREAWVAGALPELDPSRVDNEVEGLIKLALESEQRPSWRNRLLGAAGVDARRQALSEWQESVIGN